RTRCELMYLTTPMIAHSIPASPCTRPNRAGRVLLLEAPGHDPPDDLLLEHKRDAEDGQYRDDGPRRHVPPGDVELRSALDHLRLLERHRDHLRALAAREDERYEELVPVRDEPDDEQRHEPWADHQQ